MKEMWVKIIQGNWEDKDLPVNIKVSASAKGEFYVLDLKHDIRIWVYPA